MAGHSKWANIKHRKAKQDALKGKIFTKLIRAITSSARQNPDMTMNASLRLAVHKAYEANMSQDTIKKAISRGEGQGNEETMMRITYEGYGVEGIAYMVSTLTDNRNRTVGEVRHAFDKCGGMLSVEGSVSYLFDYMSWVTIEGSISDQVLEACLTMIDDVIEEVRAERDVAAHGIPVHHAVVHVVAHVHRAQVAHIVRQERLLAAIPRDSVSACEWIGRRGSADV
jgi:YebC/PmpR family DNA-binding regulatory protein